MNRFAELEELLAKNNPRFICVDLRMPQPGPERFVASIRHETTPALDAAVLDELRRQLPELTQLVELYAGHGSIRLYCDTTFHVAKDCYASAFYIAHPDEWEDLRLGLDDWFADLSEKERAEYLPEWIDDCLVFGEIPHSGNYFLIPLTGPETGSVYEFEHDGFEFIRQADSIAGFMSTICTVNDALLRSISGHTYYHDGKTDTQWYAQGYEHD